MANYNAQTFGAYGSTWQHKGYCGSGNVAGLLDSLLGRTALVVGSARGVFEDFDKAYRRNPGVVVFAVNDVGVVLPHVDHFVSLHGSRLDHWVAIRRDEFGRGYGNTSFQVHDAAQNGMRPWHQWMLLTPLMALSGMFAAQIAYLMGCERIILVGCPNDETPRYWEVEPRNADCVRVQTQIVQEMGYKPEFKNAIRSMSGWSKEFFGGVDG